MMLDKYTLHMHIWWCFSFITLFCFWICSGFKASAVLPTIPWRLLASSGICLYSCHAPLFAHLHHDLHHPPQVNKCHFSTNLHYDNFRNFSNCLCSWNIHLWNEIELLWFKNFKPDKVRKQLMNLLWLWATGWESEISLLWENNDLCSKCCFQCFCTLKKNKSDTISSLARRRAMSDWDGNVKHVNRKSSLPIWAHKKQTNSGLKWTIYNECRGVSILASMGTWLKHGNDNNTSAIRSLLMTQFCSVPPPLSCSAAFCRGEWHFLPGVKHQQNQKDGGELLQDQVAAVTTMAHTSPDGKE